MSVLVVQVVDVDVEGVADLPSPPASARRVNLSRARTSVRPRHRQLRLPTCRHDSHRDCPAPLFWTVNGACLAGHAGDVVEIGCPPADGSTVFAQRASGCDRIDSPRHADEPTINDEIHLTSQVSRLGRSVPLAVSAPARALVPPRTEQQTHQRNPPRARGRPGRSPLSSPLSWWDTRYSRGSGGQPLDIPAGRGLERTGWTVAKPTLNPQVPGSNPGGRTTKVLVGDTSLLRAGLA
jgi:hypothetical protein